MDAEYGEFGPSGCVLGPGALAIEPYTSSVDTCTNSAEPASQRGLQQGLGAEHVRQHEVGAAAIDRSTCDSAAKCTTASLPGDQLADQRRVADVALHERSRGSATGARLARFPA